ncbi:acetate--CoA ligase family protein [Aquibium sp. LZ166]|uniref:Acetate--CoA ligase family protein n=1 Tax=Aquibium pacificus TaxID=3153579 RepID=A0ABV3SRR2_9HYPH
MLNASRSLDRIFAPKSIVVVGASNDPRRIGGRPLRYLRDHGFDGDVYGVNPKYDEVQGRPCFPDIASLPDGIDLAVLMLASAHVIDAVRACGAKGIAGCVVTAAGFAEAGPEGRLRQEELASVAAECGVRLIGPNTIGFRNHNTSVYATFGTDIDSGVRPGNVAVVAQSGGLGGYLGAAQLRDLGIGTRWMIDTGNEADIDCAECVEFLSREPGISVIGLIIEGCRDSTLLLESVATARHRGIPVVVLKIGRSEAGAQSVQLHTGALSGRDAVWDAALATAGAIRARDEAHFIDLVRVLDMPKKPAGSNLGIVTLSGGVATVLLDAAERCDIAVPPVGPPPPDLKARLPLVGFSNPLDASGQMANTPDALEPLIDYMLGQDSVDVVVVWLAYALLSDVLGPVMAKGVTNAASRSDKPVIVCGMATPELTEQLTKSSVALAPYPTAVVEVLADCLRQPLPQEPCRAAFAPMAAGEEQVVTGSEAEVLLPGVPFAQQYVVADREAAGDILRTVEAPAVFKAEVPGLAHKSDLGLVRLGIRSKAEAEDAYEALLSALEKAGMAGEILAQRHHAGLELFVGASRDAVFGPTVTFGLGGIFVEVFEDTVTLLAPCSRDNALDAMRRLKGWPLLAGFRGRKPVNLEPFAALVETVSRLVAETPEIAGVDLNPVIATADAVVAVDVVVKKTG